MRETATLLSLLSTKGGRPFTGLGHSKVLECDYASRAGRLEAVGLLPCAFISHANPESA